MKIFIRLYAYLKFFFSSYRTMAILLSLYVISLAAATWIESCWGRVSARVAVYNSTWFYLLQLLMVINSDDLKAKKAQAEAMVTEAEAAFKNARRDYERYKTLHSQNSVSDKELENMAQSVNQALEQIRTERQEYEKRERAFQSEIENISHDLRTPLTVILGYLKLMKGQKETDMEMVETIERKAKTMQRLVTDFYDLSRLSARDYEVEIKETDVGRILRESLMDSYHILEKRALELEADMAATGQGLAANRPSISAPRGGRNSRASSAGR